MKRPMPVLAALTLALTGCADKPHTPERHPAPTPVSAQPTRPSPGQVLAWANLDENLGRRPETLVFGQADGRSILGEKVLVLNGEEMVRFVRAHRYQAHDGIDAAEAAGDGLTRIHVTIHGRDGARMTLLLQSDGEDPGRG